MKYTNAHLKSSYKISKALFNISLFGLILGTFILSFGFVRTKQQMDNVKSLARVLSEQSNPANKTAFIDIVEVPKKISEDEYEIYYLVTTKEDNYISGMQKEQFEVLKKEVEKCGVARLEGFTKVIIDEQVKKDVAEYIDEKSIHIRVTELTYLKTLKEGYLVNLILGGLIFIMSMILVVFEIKDLKKYKNPQAKIIDEECNRNDSIWLNEYQIYLTNNYVVTTYNGINAIDIKNVKEINLFDSIKSNEKLRILEAKTIENKSIRLFATKFVFDDIYKEDVQYLKEIFGEKNIVFNCEIEAEDYEE